MIRFRSRHVGPQISSQHPYAETFIGKPHVWTVDLTNKTDVRKAVRAILHTEVMNATMLLLQHILYTGVRANIPRLWVILQVEPFTPREFTCEGMLERVHAYVTHQVLMCCKHAGVF